MQITSSKNPLLQEVRRAVIKGTLTQDGCCIAETFHLVEEAVRSGCEIRAVLISHSVRAAERRFERLGHTEIIRIPDDVFARIAGTETTQGVMALVRPPAWELDHLFRGQSLVLILDGIQDPGNAGAILRTAEAFGATGVLFLKGTVSPYNAKAIRASAGSLFRLPIMTGLEEDLALAAAAQRRIRLYAAMPHAKEPLQKADLTPKCGFIIGSEGRGISPHLQSAAIPLRIPTTQVESLNASVAAGILVYEAWRQRHI